MAAANTVEATLRSKYVDGITEGLRKTQQAINSVLSFSVGMFQNFSAAITGGLDSAATAFNSFGQQLFQRGLQAENSMTGLGLVIAGVGVIAVTWFARMGAAAAGWVIEQAKVASDTLELKLIFEGLAKTAGVDAADAIQKLRGATEGLVGAQTILKNANRVLQADIPITIQQYTKLVENVYKLAKASGADLVSAQNMLTDAVVKGNARGFQQIGVNLQIKDAIDEMALAQGVATSKVDTDAKLRSFYNELAEKTSAAVKRNGTDYFSLADAVEKSHATLLRWTSAVGEALGRSGVFEAILKRWSDTLDQAGPKQDYVNTLAIYFNQTILTIIKTLNVLVFGLGVLAPIFNTVWQAGKAAFQSLMFLIGLVGTTVVSLLAGIVMLADELAKLAGINWFSTASKGLKELSTVFARATSSMASDAAGSVAKIFSLDNSRALFSYSDQLTALTGELEQFSGQVVKGEGGIRGFAGGQVAATADTKKLKEELKGFIALMDQLGGRLANPSQANLNTLLADFRKIDEFRHVGEEAIKDARLRALEIYRRAEEKLASERRDKERERIAEMDTLQSEVEKLQAERAKESLKELVEVFRISSGQAAREAQELFDAVMSAARKKRQEEQQKAISEAVSTASAITKAIDQARKGKIPVEIAAEANRQLPDARAAIQRQIDAIGKNPTLEQVDDVIRLREALEQLNTLNLTPFQSAMKSLKSGAMDFAGQATQAFASFFADIVSGQEGAGKKLLAAFFGMVGQMLIKTGVLLVQMGIAEIAMASTLAGRLAGASVGAGVRAIAVGGLMAAAGGVLVGAGANLAQTSQSAGASGSFQQATPRPISGQTQQIINVGAPGRGQNSGEGRQDQTGHEVTVRLEVPAGFVTREVERNVKGNGRLRTVISQYQPA